MKTSSDDSHSSGPMREQALTGVCVICSQMIYHDEDAVMHRSQDISFAYGMCESCRVAHITVEIVSGPQSTSVSLLTDLKKSEISRFWSRGKITADDVLQLRKALKLKPSTFHTSSKSSIQQ